MKTTASKALRHILPKYPLNFNGLHDIISHNIEFSLTTAVTTSNSTPFNLHVHQQYLFICYVVFI
jgi:hypothetical protein